MYRVKKNEDITFTKQGGYHLKVMVSSNFTVTRVL